MITVGHELLNHAVVYGMQYLLLVCLGWSEAAYIYRHAAACAESGAGIPQHSMPSRRGFWRAVAALGLWFVPLVSAGLVMYAQQNSTMICSLQVFSMSFVLLLQVCSSLRNVDHVFLLSFWTLRLLATSMDYLGSWNSVTLAQTILALSCVVLCGLRLLYLEPPGGRPHAEPNLIRSLFFSWLDQLYEHAHRLQGTKHVPFDEETYLRPLAEDCSCKTLLDRFQNPDVKHNEAYTFVGDGSVRPECKSGVLTIGRLLHPFRWELLLTGVNRFVLISLFFLCSYLLRVLLEENQSQTVRKWTVSWLFCISIAIAILNAQYVHETRRIGLRIQALLMGLVFESMVHSATPPSTSSATLSTDTATFVTLTQDLHMVWSGPLIIVVTLGVLWWKLVGPSALVGFGLMIAAIAVTNALAKRLTGLQALAKRSKDERVKLTTDAVEQMQQIKADQLESLAGQRIGRHRTLELSYLRQGIWYEATKHLIGSVTSVVVAFGTFLTKELVGGGDTLTLQSMFVAISLFNITRYPMSVIPTLLSSWKDTKLSMQRINGFLQAAQRNPRTEGVDNARPLNGSQKIVQNLSKELCDILGDQQGSVVQITRGQFSTRSAQEQPPVVLLHGIDLHIRPGSFTVVCGSHGSGKTSLLRALIGALVQTGGEMSPCTTKLSYYSQTPWLQHGSVRENIQFVDAFDGERYERVIHACCLADDLQTFSGRDERVVGEGGHSLSGGQAARIALARALYRRADLYLLDDPLKSLDANVSRLVFERAFHRTHGLLAGSTCIMVSHRHEHQLAADTIVEMEAGTIKSIRSPEQCASEPMLQESTETEDEEATPSIATKEPVGTRFRKVALRTQPPSLAKKVPRRLYLLFGRMLGWVRCTSVVVLEALVAALDIIIMVLFAHQQEHGFLTIGLFVIIWSLLLFLKTAVLQYAGLALARSAHREMLTNVLHQPLAFFDQHGSGAIVNRFSNDLNVLDARIVASVRMVLTNCFSVLATLILFLWKLLGDNGLFLVAFVSIGLLLVGLYWLLCYHLFVARLLKRLEASSRSPILLQYNETVQGLETIQALGAEQRLLSQFMKRVDRHMNYLYHNLATARWIGIRLEFIGAIVIYFVALLTVMCESRVGLAFLAIIVSYVLRLIPSLNGLLLAAGQLEEHIISFERVSDYMNLTRESLEAGGGNALFPTTSKDSRPVRGPIEFRNFSLAHADGSTVLQGITLTIEAGEKLGIIGRTGAGKSSLVGALFRFYPKATRGKILIGGVDVATIQLGQLRRALTLVPQNTTLLSGQVSSFIDPQDVLMRQESTRQRVISLLRQCRLEDVPLEAPLEQLSVGQRQLLCIVRGVLADRPIIVLDEATSALDDAMENRVLELMRDQFHDRTVLMIAHRLHTVRSCDRILWLQDGRVRKLAPPADFTEQDWDVLQHGE